MPLLSSFLLLFFPCFYELDDFLVMVQRIIKGISLIHADVFFTTPTLYKHVKNQSLFEGDISYYVSIPLPFNFYSKREYEGRCHQY